MRRTLTKKFKNKTADYNIHDYILIGLWPLSNQNNIRMFRFSGSIFSERRLFVGQFFVIGYEVSKTLVECVLCIPVSTVGVERMFSTINDA